MKKKILITSLFLIVVLVSYFLYLKSNEDMVELPVRESRESTRDRAIDGSNVTPDSDIAISEEMQEEFLSAQFEQYIDKVEEDWDKNMEELFLHKSSDDLYFKEYQRLKKGYEEERERRYEAFHQMMEEKHGANYSYSPSEDEEMFNEKLVKIYEENLSKIIGEEKMIEYMKVKDNFNRNLEKEAQGTNSYILIEF